MDVNVNTEHLLRAEQLLLNTWQIWQIVEGKDFLIQSEEGLVKVFCSSASCPAAWSRSSVTCRRIQMSWYRSVMFVCVHPTQVVDSNICDTTSGFPTNLREKKIDPDCFFPELSPHPTVFISRCSFISCHHMLMVVALYWTFCGKSSKKLFFKKTFLSNYYSISKTSNELSCSK